MKKLGKVAIGAAVTALLALGVAEGASAASNSMSCVPQSQAKTWVSGTTIYNEGWFYKGAFFSAGKAGYTFEYVYSVNGKAQTNVIVNCTV